MKIGPYQISAKRGLMGILNVTPDSFSDGGKFVDVQAALEQAGQLLADGAQILDIGGESTRPGATFVSQDEEIARVVPVIKAIKSRYDCLISIDTYKTATARAAIEAGADILNDVWAGLYDKAMLPLAAEKGVPIILMHNQTDETYDNVTQDVKDFLAVRAQAALEAGVPSENIWLDPGFGFSKNAQQNQELLAHLEEICQLGYPVLFGISRKRIVDSLLGGGTSPEARDQATAAQSAWALQKGCHMVRVHNVAINRDVVTTIGELVDHG